MKKRSSGLTLIELCAVLLLIGLIFVLGFTAVRHQPVPEINETARSVLSRAEACRNGAMISGIARRIVYDLDAQKLWIEIPTEDDPSGTDPEKVEKVMETRLPERVRISDIALDDTAPSTSGQIRLTAAPSGFLPTHVIHLRHTQGQIERTALVGPFPGHTRLSEGNLPWAQAVVVETEEDVTEGVHPLQ